MKSLLVFISIILSSIVYSQDENAYVSEFDYEFDFSRIQNADAIYYYGIDFSNFGLANPEKIGQEYNVQKFFPAWMNEVHIANPLNTLESTFKKDVVRTFKPVQKRYKLIGDDWIGYDKKTFDIERIKEIVKEYVLEQSSGIGFVILIENFVKESELVEVNYTFFDISTREVLYNTTITGVASGAGMTKHWTKGINNTFRHFRKQYSLKLKQN